MNKIGIINYKKIKWISPSQFYSMKNCAYKSVLAEAFEKKPLLPISPNAYLGTVLHKMLELISKKEIRNEAELKARLDEEIRFTESKLKDEGYDYLLPLQNTVKDFGIKVILLIKHLKFENRAEKHSSEIKFTSERWFESKDKQIGGKIDLIVEYGNETEIIDFKTGAITQDLLDDAGETFSEIKKEYQEQLKLYAYLYFDCTGNLPTQLTLIDLTKQRFNIYFSLDECRTIFNEAKELLSEINNSIDFKSFKAIPQEENCKYCLYRPACSFYLNYIANNNNINDVSGLVSEVIQYRNGNITVSINQGSSRVSITGIGSDKLEFFNSHRNKRISVFNLRRTATESVYSVTKTTTLYAY